MRPCNSLLHRVPVLAALLLGACGDGNPAPKQDVTYADLFPSVDLFPFSSDLPQNCSSSTCNGCCNGKICVDGITSTACGASGVPCQTCNSDESCTLGTCKKISCDSTSCPSGCCSSSGCKNGTSTSACGTSAASCVVCKTGESCLSGSCTPPAGKKLYKITLESGTIHAGGITLCMAGIGGTLDYWCDPFVWIIVGKLQAKSKTVSNDNTPSWTEEMMTVDDAALKNGIKVDLYDGDVAVDTPLGSTTYKVTDSDLSKGTLSLDIKAAGITTAQIILSFKVI